MNPSLHRLARLAREGFGLVAGVAAVVASAVYAGIPLVALPAGPGAEHAFGAGAGAEDFVTGGGWIDGTPTGARGNFGLKGGMDENGAFFGHLNYVDHEDNMHVKAESITGYVLIDETTRQIEGTARIDKESGFTFTLIVSDAGEPGAADTFELTLSNGYTASGTLQGGNIQLHEGT
jgi:hypothetical protein